MCLCKWPHLDSPSLFSGNKHTPTLLLNTPIDGSTVYHTEPHIRVITGQMIEHEAVFLKQLTKCNISSFGFLILILALNSNVV